MLKLVQGWPGPSFINFIHNWRCAGTSMNSILSSNFQRYYLKIGHPFGPLGWPETYKSNPEQLLTLGQIRSRMQESDSSGY